MLNTKQHRWPVLSLVLLVYSSTATFAQVRNSSSNIHSSDLSSTPDTKYNSEYNVVTRWNQMALELIKEAKPSPPVVARHLAIMHTCMFDAWSVYSHGTHGLYSNQQGEWQRPKNERSNSAKTKTVSAAAAICLKNLFPTTKQGAVIDALLTRHGVTVAELATPVSDPAGYGVRAAQAVIKERQNDGSNQYGNPACTTSSAYCDSSGYVPINAGSLPINQVDPNHWQPLPNGVAFQRPLAPHWGHVTPFTISSTQQFLADHPLPTNLLPALYPSVEYMKQVSDTLIVSAGLTRERKAQAILWADGPFSYLPPGHWNKVAQWVVNTRHLNIDRTLQFYAGLNWAMADAGIVSWQLKYQYDYVRPITSVRYVKNGQMVLAWGGPDTPYDSTINTATGKPFGFARYISGETFNPYNPTTNPNHPLTPAFPEYTSGHSVFSMAGALFMEKFFGSPFMGIKIHFNPNDEEFKESNPEAAVHIQADPTDPTKDFIWYFPTFRAAALHAGNSRIVSGIHFNDSNIASQKIGALLGKQAYHLISTMTPRQGGRRT